MSYYYQTAQFPNQIEGSLWFWVISTFLSFAKTQFLSYYCHLMFACLMKRSPSSEWGKSIEKITSTCWRQAVTFQCWSKYFHIFHSFVILPPPFQKNDDCHCSVFLQKSWKQPRFGLYVTYYRVKQKIELTRVAIFLNWQPWDWNTHILAFFDKLKQQLIFDI